MRRSGIKVASGLEWSPITTPPSLIQLLLVHGIITRPPDSLEARSHVFNLARFQYAAASFLGIPGSLRELSSACLFVASKPPGFRFSAGADTEHRSALND